MNRMLSKVVAASPGAGNPQGPTKENEGHFESALLQSVQRQWNGHVQQVQGHGIHFQSLMCAVLQLLMSVQCIVLLLTSARQLKMLKQSLSALSHCMICE